MTKLIRLCSALLLLVVAGACSDDGDDADVSVKGAIGLPGAGRVAWHFVGQIDQDGTKFTAYGFLTRVDGLAESALFTGGERNEDTAVFSVVMESSEATRTKLNNVTVVDVNGSATIYFDEKPSRTFGAPDTFRRGTEVVKGTVTGQNILNIDPENRDKGVAAASAEMRQTSAARFQLGGQERQIGREGLVERLTLSGEGVRTDANVPRSVIEVAGTMVVSGDSD